MPFLFCLGLACFIALVTEACCQTKGDALFRLKIGQPLETTIQNMTNPGADPTRLLIGGWFKWTRCSFVSVEASASLPDRLEPMHGLTWFPVSVSSYSASTFRIFDCNVWQNLGLIYQITPVTGDYSPQTILQIPETRPVRTWEEDKSLAEGRIIKLLIHPNSSKAYLTTHSDLIQFEPYYYLDYTTNDLISQGTALAAFTESLAGFSTPTPFVLMTDRYFVLNPPIVILGMPASGNQLLGFINEFDAFKRPGLGMRWNTTYEFPQIVNLTNMEGTFSIQPCLTMSLSFHVETMNADFLQVTTTQIQLKNSLGQKLLQGFEIIQDFNGYGGQQNGSFWSMQPRATDGQNLTTVISICFIGDWYYMKHKLFRDGEVVVDIKQRRIQAYKYPFKGQLLSLVLYTSCTVPKGNRISLREIKVSVGASDSMKYNLTKDPSPSGCLVATLVGDAGNPIKPYCLNCNQGYFWANGICTQQNPSLAGLNSTCSWYQTNDSCSSCKPGFKADLFRYECYPNTMNCQFPFYLQNDVANTCSDTNTASICSMFQYRSSPSRACVCKVANCDICQYSACDRCKSPYVLAVNSSSVRCDNPSVLSGFKSFFTVTRQYVPCQVEGCSNCSTHSAVCDTCSPGNFYCQRYINSCHSSCTQCKNNSALGCITCASGFWRLQDRTCNSTCRVGSGYFVANDTCLPCTANCLNCSGPGPFDCLLCNVNFTLTVKGNCLGPSDRKPYHYIDNTTGLLSLCHPTCKTCTGLTKDDCMSCYNVYDKVPAPANESSACTSYKCPGMPGFTARDNFSPCNISCPANVDQCVSGYYDTDRNVKCDSAPKGYLYFENNTCSQCNDPAEVLYMGYCYQCHPTCQDCNRPGSKYCTICNTSSNLPYRMRAGPQLGSCVACNITGVFVTSLQACDLCALPCTECKGTSTYCTKCVVGKFLDLATHTCVDCTTPGFVKWKDICLPCDSNCDECSQTAENCTVCSAGQQYLDVERSLCLTDADLITYSYAKSTTVANQVFPCSPNCKFCEGTATNCTGCRYDVQLYLFADHRCNYCPGTGYYLDGLLCIACDPNCLGCILNPKNCIFCRKGNYLHHDGTCVLCKMDGYYPEDQLVVPACLRCRADCLTCANNYSCLTCPENQYLYPNKSCGLCKETNMAKVGRSCVFCHTTCLTCTGSSESDCKTCDDFRFFSSTKSCLLKQNLTIIDKQWLPDVGEVDFEFQNSIQAFNLPIAECLEVGLFLDLEEKVIAAVANATVTTKLATLTKSLTPAPGFQIKDILISGKLLRFKLQLAKTLPLSVFVVKAKTVPWLKAADQEGFQFTEVLMVKPNLQLQVTELDSSLDSASAAVSNSVTALTTILFLISIPQAFVLMKVFQTIDFYIYINCEYPSNFSKFLEIFSQNLMDFVPNSIESLADDEGVPVYPRFEKFGLSIHVFKNLGRHFTFFTSVGLFKLLVMGLTRLFPKMPLAPRLDKALNGEVIFSMVEGYHLDIILGIMIHVANRSHIATSTFSMKYLSVLFISLISLGLLGCYIWMFYTVHRLSGLMRELGLRTAEELPEDIPKMWLEDKVLGNFFQRHFNLLMLIKDVWVCSLLITNYDNTLLLLILLSIYQAIFLLLILAYPPFIKKSANNILKITQGCYLVLNTAFVVNIAKEWSESTRYFVIGIWMICIVCIIVLVNISMSTMTSVKQLWTRCKKKFSRSKVIGQTSSTKLAKRNSVKGTVSPSRDPEWHDANASHQNLNQESSAEVRVRFDLDTKPPKVENKSPVQKLPETVSNSMLIGDPDRATVGDTEMVDPERAINDSKAEQVLEMLGIFTKPKPKPPVILKTSQFRVSSLAQDLRASPPVQILVGGKKEDMGSSSISGEGSALFPGLNPPNQARDSSPLGVAARQENHELRSTTGLLISAPQSPVTARKAADGKPKLIRRKPTKTLGLSSKSLMARNSLV